jgi:Holliday junction resolvase RusA-like endonuclease
MSSSTSRPVESGEGAVAGSPPILITFTIPQTPKGKVRHQTVVTLRCDRCQRTVKGQRQECPYCQHRRLMFLFSNEYTPAEQKEYERFAAMCAQQGMTSQNANGPNGPITGSGLGAGSDHPAPVLKFSGPTRVECRFFFGIPKSREKKLKDGDYHNQRPDADNCLKSIMDACNGVVWVDDCVVCKVDATSYWTTGVPRTEVKISLLPDAAISQGEGGREASGLKPEQEVTV